MLVSKTTSLVPLTLLLTLLKIICIYSDVEHLMFQGGSCKISSKNDCNDFKDLQAALEVLSFTEQEQNTIYKILASVLHLGNIYFIHEPVS